MPGRTEASKRRHAKGEIVLETARAYAFGAATEAELLEAAAKYGETFELDDRAKGQER